MSHEWWIWLAAGLAVLLVWRRFTRRRPPSRASLTRARRHREKRDQALQVVVALQHRPRCARALTLLRTMDPWAFEELVLLAFKRRGYRIYPNRRYSHDGGSDGAVVKGGRLWLIQAKRYRGYIRPSHLANFCRLIKRRGCRGFFCHTGYLGPKAEVIIQAHPKVTVLGAQQLVQMLTRAARAPRALHQARR